MIALIPARGGSKGLPRKNVLPFCGKPLITHTIEAAAGAAAIDRIVVTTDDSEIAEVARNAGAEVPFIRPPELATDVAGSREVVLHALAWLEAEGEADLETFCLLQPTSPLRTAADIDAAHGVFLQRGADAVISVTPYAHPVQWAVALEAGGLLLPRDTPNPSRRQDEESYYRPNGALYLYRTEFFREKSGGYGKRTFGYPMTPERSVDIDTRMDFVVAEAVYRELLQEQR